MLETKILMELRLRFWDDFMQIVLTLETQEIALRLLETCHLALGMFAPYPTTMTWFPRQ